MNETIQPLLQLLGGHFGWLPTVVAWVGAIRLPLKIVNGWLQGALTRFVANVAASPETDDDEQLRRVLGSMWYRLLAFSLDAGLSIKLPTTASLTIHQSTKLQEPPGGGATGETDPEVFTGGKR